MNYGKNGVMEMKRKICSLLVSVLAIVAALVLASVSVRIEEWNLPAADLFPHDPAVAPDVTL